MISHPNPSRTAKCNDSSGLKGARRPQKRILIVDDDPSVREMLGRVLRDEGYTIVLAGSGQEALELASVTRIDLVLLDLNMPGRNGWDTFEALTTQNPLLAIVIITARPNQVFTALGAGVGALLEKPLDFPKLLEVIGKLLAEPPETRLARLTGRRAEFRYLPAGQREEGHKPI